MATARWSPRPTSSWMNRRGAAGGRGRGGGATTPADLDDLTPADLGLTVPLSEAQKANIVNAALARAVPSIQVSGISSETTVQLGSPVPGQKTGAEVRPDARIAVSHRDPHGTGLAVV